MIAYGDSTDLIGELVRNKDAMNEAIHRLGEALMWMKYDPCVFDVDMMIEMNCALSNVTDAKVRLSRISKMIDEKLERMEVVCLEVVDQ